MKQEIRQWVHEVGLQVTESQLQDLFARLKPGPTKATGNYNTREELENAVLSQYNAGGVITITGVAAGVGVSKSTVHNIIKRHRDGK